MPLTLPNLDDRTYNELIDEARGLIPTYAPEWTNHNPSDPGITLLELFAFLTEQLLYRQNRITDANMYTFLKLLNGLEWQPRQSLTEEIREAVLALRQPNRAVTCTDFENLALAADARVARARCVPRRNLDSENPLASQIDRPGHVSVVIVPNDESSKPAPDSDLIQAVQNSLEPRRLLTTRIHVVGPRYFGVGVRLTLVLKPDALEKDVRPVVVKALQRFLHPLTGGPADTGWPFGRNVYVSEIYELLDTQPGVDYVTKTLDADKKPLDEFLVKDPTRLKRTRLGELTAVEIQPDELVEAQIEESNLTLVSQSSLQL